MTRWSEYSAPPTAHEDDPERAVRAALEAVAVVGDLDAGLHVRVGVATGEALVDLTAAGSSVRGMASGDVLNTAARLQAAAPVDGVLVTAATERATEREIVYEAVDPVVAKGKSAPVRCARAHAPAVAPAGATARTRPPGGSRARVEVARRRLRHMPAGS